MPKWGWMIGYAVAAIIFGVGLSDWNQAQAYVPVIPKPGVINQYAFSHPQTVRPLSRYTRLLNGELFFEKVPEPVKVFHSNLKVYGIIRGKNPRAVVGLDGNDKETSIVKLGAVVGGEMIVEIGSNFVVVRNESGEEKVNLE